MTPPPLSDELAAQASELEALIPPNVTPAGLLEVPLDVVNRTARLLRTAADVVGVAMVYDDAADRQFLDALGIDLGAGRGHIDDSGV